MTLVILIKEHYFEYRKYICSRNDKVILPLPLQDRESVFDVDRKYVVLKNIITVNTYESDLDSEATYDKIVQLNRTVKGFDDVKSLSPKDGQYYEEMNIDYENDISKWIINRPEKVMKYVCDKVNDIKSIVIKYLPESCATAQRCNLLHELYVMRDDLAKHTLIELKLLTPISVSLERRMQQ